MNQLLNDEINNKYEVKMKCRHWEIQPFLNFDIFVIIKYVPEQSGQIFTLWVMWAEQFTLMMLLQFLLL